MCRQINAIAILIIYNTNSSAIPGEFSLVRRETLEPILSFIPCHVAMETREDMGSRRNILIFSQCIRPRRGCRLINLVNICNKIESQ